jgi:hypothetical protein
MARTLSGTLFSIATAFGSAVTVSAVTNASEAVVTATAHGFVAGDILEVTSGWGGLQLRALRVKAGSVTTNAFTLEGMDTTNTTLYPPGSGIGSARKVSTWVQITTVLNPSTSGGEAKSVTYKYVESNVEFKINDGFSSVDRTMSLDADAIASPGYIALKSLTQVQTNTMMRSVAKSGAVSYLPCTVALNEEEIMQDGQIVTVNVAISGNNISTRYAS